MATSQDIASFDRQTRALIYDEFMQTGLPPSSMQAAVSLSCSQAAVGESFGRLAAGRVIVLQPENGEILMANPFSAVPTPFLVASGGQIYFGNCIWDALGIPAMLRQDAVIQSSCADCGLAIRLHVTGGELQELSAGIAHFAVPARQWWENIVFT